MLTILEQHLTKHGGPFLAGSDISLADVSYAPYFGSFAAAGMEEELAAFPALSAWWKTVSARPAWAYALELAAK